MTASDISNRVQVVRTTDRDLNGVADLLEDLALTEPAPFAGVPFVITGCIEAEQFDFGGVGISYTNVAGNAWTNDYRASGMQITNCTDRGGGYFVDDLREGDWTQYTIDVRVGQTYAVEARTAAHATGGVFRVDFIQNGVTNATTGPLTITSTNWTNVTARLVSLTQGTNYMRVAMLTNAPGTNYVGKLNYISVYPDWYGWVTNAVQTNDVRDYGSWSTNSDYASASNNAVALQAAIDGLSLGATEGGVVSIPEGTFYLAQTNLNEAHDLYKHAAGLVYKNNVEIRGAGKTNTVLVCFSRSTTILYAGRDRDAINRAVTNITVRDLTLMGRPHLVAITNGGQIETRWEQGGLLPESGHSTGSLMGFEGASENQTRNIAITNCLFRNPAYDAIVLPGQAVINTLVRHCDFRFREDGTNASWPFPRSVSTASSRTHEDPSGQVGFFGRAGANNNVVFIENTYNGSSNIVSVNTNYYADGSDGIFWMQNGGNWFVAHNSITNYVLEGLAIHSGPAIAVINEYNTLVSLGATTALNGSGTWAGPTGSETDFALYFVANQVSGGRHGELSFNADPDHNKKKWVLHLSGNSFDLLDPFSLLGDYPGGAASIKWIYQGNISGNTLVNGGHGVYWTDNCTNTMVLKNDFSGTTYRSLDYVGTNGMVNNVTIAKNVLNQGAAYHLKTRPPDSGRFFLLENRFTNSAGLSPAVLDSLASPVHIKY